MNALGTAGGTSLAGASVAANGEGVTISLPLEITVRLGRQPLVAYAGVPATNGTAGARRPLTRANAEVAAQRLDASAAAHGAVLGVRAGRLFREGLITDDYGVT